MNILVNLIVPLILLAIGGVAKKLIRGRGWRFDDWYLGEEASLAGLSAGITNILDIVQRATASIPAAALAPNAIFLVFALIAFLIVLGVHQEYSPPMPRLNGQFRNLGLLANGLGLGSLTAALIMRP